jgi:hypothetical protein
MATPVIAAPAVPEPVVDASEDLERGFQYLQRADFGNTVASWAAWLQAHPKDPMTAEVRDGLVAAARLRGLIEARSRE